MEKRCRDCGETKPTSEFYMGGTAPSCRSCYSARVRARYRAKIDQCRAYERKRAQDPLRKEKRREYQRRSNEKDPQRRAARVAVGNAIRDGRLVRQPCEVCGERAEAHHADYARPLDVRWLCFRHHRADEHRQHVGG